MPFLKKVLPFAFIMAIAKVTVLFALAPGERVMARWNLVTDPCFYPARVSSVENGMVSLVYDDGTVGSMTDAAVLRRDVQVGDFVFWGNNAAAVAGMGKDQKVSLRLLDLGDISGETTLDGVKFLLRPKGDLAGVIPDPREVLGTKVFAKWNDQIWYPGEIDQTQGEALHVQFADGTDRWFSPEWVRPFHVKTGDRVYVANPTDQQPFPGVVRKIGRSVVDVEFFDGSSVTVSEQSLLAFLDRPWIDESAGCPCFPKNPEADPVVQELRSLLAPRLHFYTPDPESVESGISPETIEVGLVLFSPSDRVPPEDWRKKLTLVAQQVEDFLKRELSPWATVRVFVPEKPVRSLRNQEWYSQNLSESQAWHDWQPTGACLLRAFPDGPKAGAFRVVVVIPDAPGLCQDDSGFENGMGFVRTQGETFSGLTEEGLRMVASGVPPTSFKEWCPDFAASTMAHEIIHTLGVPHSDGDPFEIMNLGPWYPITRPEVHLGELHKIVLRSPFLNSLSLSQGFAGFLLDRKGEYLKTISCTGKADPDLRLRFGRGPGLFRLEETLEAFSPGSNARNVERLYAGERELCRAYLTSFIAFVLEKYGTPGVKCLLPVPEEDAAAFVASALKTTVSQLEKEWHEWIGARIPGIADSISTTPAGQNAPGGSPGQGRGKNTEPGRIRTRCR